MASAISCVAAKWTYSKGSAMRGQVVVEFPNVNTAERWYAFAEYAQALEVRDRALASSLVFVDGFSAG